MRMMINDTEVVIPSTLSEMSLGQRIDLQEKIGNQLDEMLKSVMSIEDETEREIEMIHFQMEKMFRTMAYFMNCTVEAIKESSFIDNIAHVYFASLDLLLEEERREEIELKESFIWKGEEWELYPPELKNGDRMTFGEFIDSKQIVQDLIKLGKNKWECLLPLSAIFLRKKGEDYEESFLYEGSDRLNLMKELPMDIAIQVGFFLKNSVSLFTKPFQYSTQVA